MKLGYFTMPMHPEDRSPTETLQEDREAIILADRLGFHDAFVGEHLTEKTENIPNSMEISSRSRPRHSATWTSGAGTRARAAV